MQQGSGRWVSSDPQSDQVSAQLSVGQQSVVRTRREEGGVQVTRQCSLAQGQLLHSRGCVLVTLFDDGLHNEASRFNNGQRWMLEQLEQRTSKACY